MNPSKVCISIMIPTYKRNDLLFFALKSALEQKTSYDFEVVVLDNDVDGEVPKVIESFIEDKRLCYFKNEKNLGMIGNWNRCLEVANGNYIKILHDDDVLEENFIQCAIDVLEIECAEFLCTTSVLDPMKMGSGSSSVRLLNIADFAISSPTPFPGIVLKKELINKLGGFDESWYPIMDYDYWFRAFLISKKSIRLDRALSYYRVLDNESLKFKTFYAISQKHMQLFDDKISIEIKQNPIKIIFVKFLIKLRLVADFRKIKPIPEEKKEFFKLMGPLARVVNPSVGDFCIKVLLKVIPMRWLVGN